MLVAISYTVGPCVVAVDGSLERKGAMDALLSRCFLFPSPLPPQLPLPRVHIDHLVCFRIQHFHQANAAGRVEEA